jgi:hypothetical protein
MMRLAWIAGFAAGVDGLQINDAPAPLALDGRRAMTGSASALDPELINIGGDQFHVTVAGSYVMIGLPGGQPPGCNPETPDSCDLIYTANFDKLEYDGDCNDLMIRNLTIQGTLLGNGAAGVTKVDFSILSDVGNSSDALGFQVNDGPYLTMADFQSQMPPCTVSQQRGYFTWPTKNTYRFRTTTYNVECGLDFGNTELKLHFSTVYRGMSSYNSPTYANDMSFTISNVGTDAIGLLGIDDNSSATLDAYNCSKKQPVLGPYQRRNGPKFPKRHHWGAR